MEFPSSLDPLPSAVVVGLVILVAWIAARLVLRIAAKLMSFVLTAIVAAVLVYLALHYLF